jgi:hypothetical protein
MGQGLPICGERERLGDVNMFFCAAENQGPLLINENQT